jgi:hypothetical protein
LKPVKQCRHCGDAHGQNAHLLLLSQLIIIIVLQG